MGLVWAKLWRLFGKTGERESDLTSVTKLFIHTVYCIGDE